MSYYSELENTFNNVVTMQTAPAIITCILLQKRKQVERVKTKPLLADGSSVCNPMTPLSIIISLISFFPVLSAACRSLCFFMFHQEVSDLFLIGTCYKPPGPVSERVFCARWEQLVASWEPLDRKLQLCLWDVL